jgi:hypothetical protein
MKKNALFSGLALSLFLVVLFSALITPASEAKYDKPTTEVVCTGHALLGVPPKIIKEPTLTQLSNGTFKLEGVNQWTYVSDKNTGLCKILNAVNTVNTTIVGGTSSQADNSIATYGTFVNKPTDNKGGFKGTFTGFAVPYDLTHGLMKSQIFAEGKGFGSLSGYTISVYEITIGAGNIPYSNSFTDTIKYTGENEDS